MNIHRDPELVKHLRKLAREHGFRDVLYALSEVAARHRGGRKKAQWGFLSYELKDIAHDEVPE